MGSTYGFDGDNNEDTTTNNKDAGTDNKDMTTNDEDTGTTNDEDTNNDAWLAYARRW